MHPACSGRPNSFCTSAQARSLAPRSTRMLRPVEQASPLALAGQTPSAHPPTPRRLAPRRASVPACSVSKRRACGNGAIGTWLGARAVTGKWIRCFGPMSGLLVMARKIRKMGPLAFEHISAAPCRRAGQQQPRPDPRNSPVQQRWSRRRPATSRTSTFDRRASAPYVGAIRTDSFRVPECARESPPGTRPPKLGCPVRLL